MDAIIPQIVDGPDTGSAYAPVALGLTLIFGTLGVASFAHGALFTLGAFCPVAMQGLLTLSRTTIDETRTDFPTNPMKVDVPCAQDWCGERLGGAMERGLIRRFYKRPHADRILVTFGLAIVLQEIVKHVRGAKPIPTPAASAFRDSIDSGALLGLRPLRDRLPLLADDLPRLRHGGDRGRVRVPPVRDLRHGDARRHGRP